MSGSNEQWQLSTIPNHGQVPENLKNFNHVPLIPSLTAIFKSQYPRESLETSLAQLENVEYALCFPSGLGALTAILTTLFKSGDHFIISSDAIGSTLGVFNYCENNLNMQASFVDLSKLENIKNSIQPNTRLIFFESPTNPECKVMDIHKISSIAKKHKIIVAVDNTFLTACYQKPLEHGADISVYSLSKYYNGHGDVIMGATVTNKKKLHDKLKLAQHYLGIVPSPFDCSLILDGLKTLHLRIKQQFRSAVAIAEFLENHPKITKVHYPSLPSHPQYDLTKKQTAGGCGILAFVVKGNKDNCDRFLKSLNLFTMALSLGGTESLLAIPFYMAPTKLSVEERIEAGMEENFIRMSVGLEEAQDLIDDLKQALDIC